MKRVFIVLSMTDNSRFDPADDRDLDALAEDALSITDGVKYAVVYASVADLKADIDDGIFT